MKFLLESTRTRYPDDTIISFFFNSRGDAVEQSTVGFYRHMLHQLLSLVPRLQSCVIDNIKRLESQGWQLRPLKDMFRTAVLRLNSESLTCFIDALDESPEDELRDMIEFFEELGDDIVARCISSRICFFSRHYPNVELERCQYLNLDDQPEHEQGIELYLQSKLRPHRGSISDEILTSVRVRSQGVFLWAVLVTQMLRKDYQRGDIHRVRDSLERLPDGLHTLFNEMIHRGAYDQEDDRNLVPTLQWIAFARRPLTLQELYFAVRSEDPNFNVLEILNGKNVDTEIMELFILNCSKGLAELMAPCDWPGITVQFIHESVRDFLQETGFELLTGDRDESWLESGHDRLMRCCLRWTVSSSPEHVRFRELHLHERLRALEHRLSQRSQDMPPGTDSLLSYAFGNMIEHAEIACTNGVPQDSFIEGFPLGLWVGLERLKRTVYDYDHPSLASITELLVYKGSKALLAIELKRAGGHLPPDEYEVALQLALSRHESMAYFQMLLDNRPSSDSSMIRRTETLATAIRKCNVTALEAMFERGTHTVPLQNFVDVITKAIDHLGRADLAKLLLDQVGFLDGADVDLQPAIQAIFKPACAEGDKPTVAACFRMNADPNSYYHQRPMFSTVCAHGHNEILKSLFEHGADAGVEQGWYYHEALFEASSRGSEAIIHTLAIHGATVPHQPQ
jgi:hypothetical protein